MVIETGVAHGGSLMLYASILETLGHGEVLGIELNLYDENRKAIEEHPLSSRIRILDGSSISYSTLKAVREIATGKTLVCLDSNHTHYHVYQELILYAPVVKIGSYIVVFDTMIEGVPRRLYPDKNYSKGNNPQTAVSEFLSINNRFEVDREIDERLMISSAPGGYLKCVSD